MRTKAEIDGKSDTFIVPLKPGNSGGGKESNIWYSKQGKHPLDTVPGKG